MSNVGVTRSRGDLFRTALLEGSLPTQLRYFAEITVGTPTAVIEVPINGEFGSRFYLPDNCVVAASVAVTVWELNQVTDTQHPAGVMTLEARRINGVTTLNSQRVDSINGSFTFVHDATNESLNATYEPPLNTTSIVTAVMTYSISALDLRVSNYYSISN